MEKVRALRASCNRYTDDKRHSSGHVTLDRLAISSFSLIRSLRRILTREYQPSFFLRQTKPIAGYFADHLHSNFLWSRPPRWRSLKKHEWQSALILEQTAENKSTVLINFHVPLLIRMIHRQYKTNHCKSLSNVINCRSTLRNNVHEVCDVFICVYLEEKGGFSRQNFLTTDKRRCKTERRKEKRKKRNETKRTNSSPGVESNTLTSYAAHQTRERWPISYSKTKSTRINTVGIDQVIPHNCTNMSPITISTEAERWTNVFRWQSMWVVEMGKRRSSWAR